MNLEFGYGTFKTHAKDFEGALLETKSAFVS